MKNHFHLKYFNYLLVIFFLLSCGAKIKKDEETVRAEARNYYLKGKRSLQADSLLRAENNFQKALRINPFFAPAYEGLGLIALQKGGYDDAEKLFNKALLLDANWVPAEIGLLQAKVKRKEYAEALKEAERINKALQIKTYSSPVHEQLTKEVTYWKDKALQGLESDIVYQLGAWQSLKNIAGKDLINRSEFTACFIDVFSEKIEQLPPLSPKPAEDLRESMTYFKQIEKAIKYGIVKAYPDDLFRPGHLIKRAEIALIIDNFLNLLNIQQRPVNESCRISDINSLSPIYTPLCRVVSLGIMQNSENGQFHPDNTVSGYKALQILARLKEYLERAS